MAEGLPHALKAELDTQVRQFQKGGRLYRDAEVDRIITALQSGRPWVDLSDVPVRLSPGHPAIPHFWDPLLYGIWHTPVVAVSRCPQRVKALQDPWSIRTKARVVWRDNGNCLAAGNLDAGMCIDSGGKVRCLPSMIIFGTGKGGTAELQNWLSRHPVLRRFGDPYRETGGGEADYFGRELRSAQNLEATWRDYLAGFAPHTLDSLRGHYTFEKSPGYLAHSTSPGLLRAVMPSVKLIAILRDPTRRAYSHFQMACHSEKGKMNQYRELIEAQMIQARKFGGKVTGKNDTGLFRKPRHGRKRRYCTAADFDRFLAAAGPRIGNTVDGLFMTGHYVDDLLRWERFIPPEQILIVLNEDLVADAIGLFDRIQRFLGVPHFDYTPLVERVNGKTVLKNTTSKSAHSSYPPMSAAAQNLLDQYYSNSTLRLMKHLGRTTMPKGWYVPK